MTYMRQVYIRNLAAKTVELTSTIYLALYMTTIILYFIELINFISKYSIIYNINSREYIKLVSPQISIEYQMLLFIFTIAIILLSLLVNKRRIIPLILLIILKVMDHG